MAGSMMSDVNMQHETPIVSTRPRLCKPRCEAIINEPKPTIVVIVSTSTATAVDCDMRYRPRCSR